MKKQYFLISILFVFVNCLSKKKEKQQSVQNETNKEQIISKREFKQEDRKKVVKILDTLPPKKISRTLKQYEENVNMFSIEKFKDNLLTVEEVTAVTPTTDKEYSFYYGLTYSDEKNQYLHDMITAVIFDKAFDDKGDVLFLYISISEFVDGEYAESYYEYVETVVSNNKRKFCAIYKYLSKKTKWIFEPLYLEVCKGIMRSENDY
jgi:hypothetical protein